MRPYHEINHSKKSIAEIVDLSVKSNIGGYWTLSPIAFVVSIRHINKSKFTFGRVLIDSICAAQKHISIFHSICLSGREKRNSSMGCNSSAILRIRNSKKNFEYLTKVC